MMKPKDLSNLDLSWKFIDIFQTTYVAGMNHQELLHKKVRFFLIGDNGGLRTFVKILIDSSYLYDLPL